MKKSETKEIVPNLSLVKDLVDLQRMASIRGIEIAVVITERSPKMGQFTPLQQPGQVIGIECLPNRSYLKSNIL